MRPARLTLAALFVLAFAACQPRPSGGVDAHADALAREHAGHAPTASPAAAGADTLDVTTARVAYATLGGRAVTGVLARPSDAPADAALPGVIVIQEWWGLNANVEAMARRIAAQGYTALAVDLYDGRTAETPDAARALLERAMGRAADLTENLRQAHAYLADTQRAPRVGSIGWCFGGMWSLRTALALPAALDAAVVYYGNPETDRAALAPLQMPVLAHFGEADASIPLATVRAFEAAMRAEGKDAEVFVYDSADHAFANPSGPNYDAAAAELAWGRTAAFFAEHLK